MATRKTRKRKATGRPLESGAANPQSPENRAIRRESMKRLRAENADLKARLEAVSRAGSDPNADTSPGVMRKVLGQEPAADLNPAEQTLRAWLVQSPKDFISAIEAKEDRLAGYAGLKEENARLSAELSSLRGSSSSGPDLGAAKAREIVEWLLREFNETVPEGKP